MSRRRTRLVDPGSRPGPHDVIVTQKPDPGTWAAALKLAGGDRSRLRVNPDRSVTVRNPSHPRSTVKG